MIQCRCSLVLVQAGTRVTVYLSDVPQEAATHAQYPFVLFGLLQHEHKKTVLNFTVQRNTEYDGSVRSKVCGCCDQSMYTTDTFFDRTHLYSALGHVGCA